jgi:hypothetical protein
MERTGTVYVSNEMSSEQTLKVNGAYYRIPPHTTNYRIESVPVGTLTTELVGYESPKNWTIAAPHYQQRIKIAPDPAPAYPQQRVVYRQIVDYPPVIEYSPVYVYR